VPTQARAGLSESRWALTAGVPALREDYRGGGEGEPSGCPRRLSRCPLVTAWVLVLADELVLP
jgi:hypothetical protein